MRLLFWRKNWPLIIRTIVEDYKDYQSIMIVGVRNEDDLNQAWDTFIQREVKKLRLK